MGKEARHHCHTSYNLLYVIYLFLLAPELRLEQRYAVLETAVLPIGRFRYIFYMAGALGFEPRPEVLETSLYGFEDRCATVTPYPYIKIISFYIYILL